MLKVIIVGYGEMFTNLIAGTLDAKCEIVGVLRGDRKNYNPLVRRIRDSIIPSLDYSYIKSYNLPEIKARSINSKEFKKAVLKLNPDVILVGSWSEKIRMEIFTIPRLGVINAHPSLLPLYRGANPYYQVIKHREDLSGISLHLVDENYDTGAILFQRGVEVLPDDTGESLKKRTVLVARGAVFELLNKLQEDVIIPLTQIEERATYYSSKDMEIMLDFRKSSEEVYANIRAIHPWGKTFFGSGKEFLSPDPHRTYILDNNTDYHTPASVVEISPENLGMTVVCGDDKLIKFEGLKLYKKEFLTKLFLKCLKNKKIIKPEMCY